MYIFKEYLLSLFFTPRSDRCNLSCYFLKLLILTMKPQLIKIINHIVKKSLKKYANFL